MRTWTIGAAILWFLFVVLAGCSASAQVETAALKPLQGAGWPTPRPTAAPPSPTPFPKPDPAQVRRVDDRIAAGVGADLVPAQTGSDALATASRATAGVAPTESDSPIARVRGPKGVNVRKGPGVSFPVIAGLRAGDAVTVLGVNEPDRNWAFVQTAAGKQGWVSLSLLTLSGSAADLPAVAARNPQSATPAPALERSASAGVSYQLSPPVTSLSARA